MRSVRLAVYLLSACLAAPAAAAGGTVDFDREVQPILAGSCFKCHGPDSHNGKGGLRLDTQTRATRQLRSGDRAIVPGKPAASALYERIISTDAHQRMPPPRSGKALTAREIATVKLWIEQGGHYAPHWAYVPPSRPALPVVKDTQWPMNPIDRFILARLEKEGLSPAPPAERYALVRRVYIDLTGLPPTPEQADRFVHDPRPDAYARLVDRLLASTAYGERWAGPWLDLARYADSQGYANDPDRTIWRWRDWLIRALNTNMPYDRLTVDMLAGDLLPHPGTSEVIATGFHRNTLTNTEGGTNPEEFRHLAVVDRVNTTFEVWMGTTIGCAQCHDHKYDPFSQKEYYQLYAIFNNTQDANRGDDVPTIRVADVGDDKEFAHIETDLARARQQLTEETRKLDQGQASWEKSPQVKSLPKEIAAILNVPEAKRRPRQKQKLSDYHRSLSTGWKQADARVRTLTARLDQVSTTTPIMREGKPRASYILIRGNFQTHGDPVQPGLPAVFPQPQPGQPMNRLTLARWLVDGRNPLTARVAANRLWEEIFGVGLVETSEEFGNQGERPSHPELLDWLATEYVRSDWDSKHMLRLIVTSAAYRQSARVTPTLLERDPYNRLLSRGPRVRLSAEAVRDQALSASGLLSRKMYGPPVQPPQPNFGLSAAFGGSEDWQTSQGADRYRRGLYTRWRRNAPYPSLTTFDAPERTVCTIRRVRTNTPLQALVTLNDPVYVCAAQALGRRMAQRSGSVNDRIAYGFRKCLTRPPRVDETRRLVRLFEGARARYRKDHTAAVAMATQPLGPAPRDMDSADLAAWTVVGNVLLNLDETLDKR